MKARHLFVSAALFSLCVGGIAGNVAAQSTTPQEPFHTVFLIRHAAYVATPDAGDLGPPLNSLGIAQARILAVRLKGLPGSTDALIASPMIRAHQTARLVARELPGVELEVNPAVAECRPFSAVPAASAADAEAEAECTAGLDSVYAALVTPSAEPRRTTVIAHGNVIRYLVTRALGVDGDVWQAMSIGHTSITRIVVGSDGSLQVIAIGDVGHLPANLQSGATGLLGEALTAP